MLGKAPQVTYRPWKVSRTGLLWEPSSLPWRPRDIPLFWCQVSGLGGFCLSLPRPIDSFVTNWSETWWLQVENYLDVLTSNRPPLRHPGEKRNTSVWSPVYSRDDGPRYLMVRHFLRRCELVQNAATPEQHISFGREHMESICSKTMCCYYLVCR